MVVYDQGACTAAARAWWVFGYYGLGLQESTGEREANLSLYLDALGGEKFRAR